MMTNASHQLGFATSSPPSPGPRVNSVLLAGMGQTTSQQQAGSFFHPCPASQSCRHRDTGCKVQQRIRGDCTSAGPCQQSQQDRPARVIAVGSHPEHLSASSSRSHNPCPAATQTALPCTSSLRTPQAPMPPHHSGEEFLLLEGTSQVLSLHPHQFRRLILLGDFQAPCAPQTTRQRLHPGTKPAKPDTGQSHARSGLVLCRSTARVQSDLSVQADVQDAKFKFKVGGVGGRAEKSKKLNLHGWKAGRSTAQDPAHVHFSTRTSPRRGEERGETTPATPLPRAYHHTHTWSQGKF